MGIEILAIGCYKRNAWEFNELEEENFIDASESGVRSLAVSSAVATQTCRKVSEESVVSMTAEAIHDCLGKCGVLPRDIKLIVHVSPILGHVLGDATRIQKAAELTNAAAYQMKGMAYSGILMAMNHSAALIQAGVYNKILISVIDHIGAESWEKSNEIDSFSGDLALAMLLSRSDKDAGPISFCQKRWPESSYTSPIEYAVRDEKGDYRNKSWPKIPVIKMEQILAMEKLVHKHGYETVQKSLEMAGITATDIRWFISFNSGEKMAKVWRDSLATPKRCRVESFVDAQTCTMSNIPYSMMMAMEERKFLPGEKILFHGADSSDRLISAVWKW